DPGAAEALALWAIPHAREERLLRITAPGEPLRIARSRGLPVGARASDGHTWYDVLPLVARRDGFGVRSGPALELDGLDAFDAADRLLLRGTPGAATASALLWPVVNGREFALPFELDSVEIVAVRSLRQDEPLRLERLAAQARGARLELAFAAPAIPAAGMGWTLLLDSALAPRVATRSTQAASAPPPAAGPWSDVARERGIEFTHFEGPEPQVDIRPTMGPGLAWGDLDGDGWNDLYLAQGAGRAGSRAPLDRVYRNEAGRRFVDVSAASGIRDDGAGMGVCCLDAENDGDLDVYVANYGRDRLYANDGRAQFADVSAAVGLAGERWHAGVAAADYDQDGDVDVYVTSYLEYAPDKMPPREELAYQRDDPIEMLPFAFPGQANTLWRNDLERGALRFTDVAVELGVDDPAGRGMQAIWWDCDGDADLDLYVANDVSPNRLFRNEGGGRFKDVSFSAGVDDPRGSMGLAADDVDGDLDLDLFVTNWQLEANALYLNNLVNARSSKTHTATFRDAIVQTRMAGASIGLTKWGTEFVDNDRDGDLDLFVANGYTSPDYESTGICVGQRCQYFEQEARLAFREQLEGPVLAAAFAHRALAACDYDQDGDLDLALSA
ncbi:MAG: VCBS repeat-containing protein, partial [Planctomycetota bacterium]